MRIIVILWFRVCDITVWYNLVQTDSTTTLYRGKNIAFDLNKENIVSNVGTVNIMTATFCSTSITDSMPCTLVFLLRLFFTLSFFLFFPFFFVFCFLNCYFVITWDFGHSNWFDSRYKKQPFKGILIKRCSENMQQICKRTPNTHAEMWFQ